MDPTQLIQQLMAQHQEPPIPGPKMQGQIPPGAAAPGPESAAPTASPPTDEAMLDTVHNAMGERSAGGPPPGSGMKWENLEEDQAALQANPSPENIDAFVQYWGEENLPEGIQGGAQEETPEE
jgi:hypothetical protein